MTGMPNEQAQATIADSIRSIPGFPKPGIVFRDITTLLKDHRRFAEAVDGLAAPFAAVGVDKVASVEARGFIFGAALALRLNAGFVPIRKPGKLPADVLRREYALEYGSDAVEIHRDAISPKDRILVHDDLLATGGTIHAACSLIEDLGGLIVGVSFLVELTFLNGRQRLGSYPVHSLVRYTSE